MKNIKTLRAVNKPNKWFGDNIMNFLVDYYPEVQFRPYGSGIINAEGKIIKWLKELKLGYLCVYAKGHSGYTTWESSLKTAHNMLAIDMCDFFRKVTRKANTRLILYYSGLTDGIAGMRHPEWRMKNPDGTDKELFPDFKMLIGYCNCPLSSYFEDWVAIHLKELIENYDPDGIWVDGDWAGPCYCQRCQERFRKETGIREPWAEVIKRADFYEVYRPVWLKIESEWRERFNAYVKKLKPTCVYSAGNVSPRREFLAPFDWRSGDFFSPGYFMLHDMARMMRWYDTLNIPYDAYICDTSFTHARKDVRSRSKTLQRMLQEAATVASNGGSVGYWTYPLGNGAFIPSRMRKAIEVRQYLARREQCFRGTRGLRWTAIIAADPSMPAFGGVALEGAHKLLAELHKSPLIMDETELLQKKGKINDFELIIVPEEKYMNRNVVTCLANFVKNGGKLLTTGKTMDSVGMQELAGIQLLEKNAVTEGNVIPKNGYEPVGIDMPWDKVKCINAKEIYPLYLSWDQYNPEARQLPNNWPMHGQMDEDNPEPAGMPAAVLRKFGKGIVLHVPSDVFGYYRRFGDRQIFCWLKEIIDLLIPSPLFSTNAPSWVDVSIRWKDDNILVHFVNQNPGRDVCMLNTDDLWVDEIPEIGPFTVEMRLKRAPTVVYLEPDGKKINFRFENGLVSVVLPRMHIHVCLVIKGVKKTDFCEIGRG